MGFSYSAYFGPAVIIANSQDGPKWIPTEEIEERLYEARTELKSPNGKRYLLPNRRGYGFNISPREDCSKEPEVVARNAIEARLANFQAAFSKDISWVREKFPNADISIEFVVLMEAM